MYNNEDNPIQDLYELGCSGIEDFVELKCNEQPDTYSLIAANRVFDDE